MSNQDEDEVEDELEALEREVTGVTAGSVTLPDAPNIIKEQMPNVPSETAEQKARRLRRQEEARGQTAEAMPA